MVTLGSPGFAYCTDSVMFGCAGSGIFVMFKETQQTSPDMAPVNVILTQSYLRKRFNIILNVHLLILIGHDICSLPVVGAGGLTVLFNQSFLARFSTQSAQIGYGLGNVGTVTGNIFYNGIANSQLSLTVTNIYLLDIFFLQLIKFVVDVLLLSQLCVKHVLLSVSLRNCQIGHQFL